MFGSTWTLSAAKVFLPLEQCHRAVHRRGRSGRIPFWWKTNAATLWVRVSGRGDFRLHLRRPQLHRTRPCRPAARWFSSLRTTPTKRSLVRPRSGWICFGGGRGRHFLFDRNDHLLGGSRPNDNGPSGLGGVELSRRGQYHPNSARWLEFDVFEPMRLLDVTLFASGTYDHNESSTPLAKCWSSTLTVTDGKFFAHRTGMEPGTDYALRCYGRPQLWREGTSSVELSVRFGRVGKHHQQHGWPQFGLLLLLLQVECPKHARSRVLKPQDFCDGHRVGVHRRSE